MTFDAAGHETIKVDRWVRSSMPAELRNTGFNRKELTSEIEIDATPERVWSVLSDFGKFPEWNPFIRSISGKAEKGERLNVTLHPSGGRTINMSPTVLEAEPGRELRWIGHLGISGLFDGQHIFELKPSGTGKTTFVQRELFGGILLPFLTGMLRGETARGFSEMNTALKERAERPS
jgi:hypothetical protein